METKIQIKKIKEQVRETLTLHPETKNSDLALLNRIWYEEASELGCSTFIGFLQLLKEGQISHPASIIRCRTKLQKDDPSMRGTNQEAKHAVQELVKHDLKTFNEPQ